MGSTQPPRDTDLVNPLCSDHVHPKSGVELHDEQLWARIWNLQIHPKLRFFLWKVVHGILPTFDALQSRQLEIASLCPVCNEAAE
ncbi:hypothetical protein LINGRAHAP2_LOCUS30470 [Linum grandiflorum]